MITPWVAFDELSPDQYEALLAALPPEDLPEVQSWVIATKDMPGQYDDFV